MTQRLRSIRFRVTLLATATTAVLVLAFGWWLTELVADDLVRSGEEALSELTDDVDGLALVGLGEEGAEFRVENERVIASLEVDDDGDLYAELFFGDGPDDDVVGAFVLDTGTGELREIIQVDDGLPPDELRSVSEEIADSIVERAGETGTERLDVIESTRNVLDDVSDGVSAARNAAWRIGPLLVLMSGVVTWFVVGRALAPTRRIAEEAAAITTERLDHRITRDGQSDEVDTIARVINEMLDRIEDDVRREQQFVADASHELKTPLATARMAAELAGQDAPTSEYPPQLIEEVDRMQALVDDLLELARGSSTNRPVADVRLDELVAAVVAGHPASETTHVAADEGLVVVGNAPELRRVVLNLLDNAARYTRSRVEVRVERQDNSIVLLVDDDGPGIPADDRIAVFDRFTRLDEGRGRAEGGSGIGLAIVRAIADRHGGTVTAGESPLGGARIEVRIPTAAQVHG